MHFIFIITNLNNGGAEKAILNLATQLSAKGHQASIILLNSIIKYPVPESLKIYFVSKRVKISGGILSKKILAIKLHRLWKKINKHTPIDVTLSTLPFCDEIVKNAKIPNVIFRIANTLSEEIRCLSLTNEKKAIKRKLKYQKLYGDSKLIAVGNGVAKDLVTNFKISKPIEVIYNLFDKEKIQQKSFELINCDLPQRPYAVHMGRYSHQKRHDLLLEAWKNAQLDMDLLLLCEPCEELKKLINFHSLEDRVKIIGFQKNPYPILRQSELFILCSDREGLPNSLVEAILCQTRVISTNCPNGPNEILTGDLNKWLIPVDCVDKLKEAILQALATPKENFQHSLKEFDFDLSLNKYLNLAKKN
jgi:glycosyltransferase involved in cell wall biosynthesis